MEATTTTQVQAPNTKTWRFEPYEGFLTVVIDGVRYANPRRQKTEGALRSMLVAYEQNRYSVSIHPSAMGWLTGAAFMRLVFIRTDRIVRTAANVLARAERRAKKHVLTQKEIDNVATHALRSLHQTSMVAHAAQDIVRRVRANCDDLNTGRIDHATFHARATAIWSEAAVSEVLNSACADVLRASLRS